MAGFATVCEECYGRPSGGARVPVRRVEIAEVRDLSVNEAGDFFGAEAHHSAAHAIPARLSDGVSAPAARQPQRRSRAASGSGSSRHQLGNDAASTCSTTDSGCTSPIFSAARAARRLRLRREVLRRIEHHHASWRTRTDIDSGRARPRRGASFRGHAGGALRRALAAPLAPRVVLRRRAPRAGVALSAPRDADSPSRIRIAACGIAFALYTFLRPRPAGRCRTASPRGSRGSSRSIVARLEHAPVVRILLRRTSPCESTRSGTSRRVVRRARRRPIVQSTAPTSACTFGSSSIASRAAEVVRVPAQLLDHERRRGCGGALRAPSLALEGRVLRRCGGRKERQLEPRSFSLSIGCQTPAVGGLMNTVSRPRARGHTGSSAGSRGEPRAVCLRRGQADA